MRQGHSFNKNLLDEAQKNLLMQYQSDDKFTAWIDTLVQPLETLKRFLLDTERVFNIDVANGWWLDRLGRLVDVERKFSIDVNGVVVSYDLDDDNYRKLIKAKIAKIFFRGTFQDCIDSIDFITSSSSFALIESPEGESMTLGVAFNTPISNFLRDLILYSELSPRPMATRYYYNSFNTYAFAFDDSTFTQFPHGYWDDTTIGNTGYWIF